MVYHGWGTVVGAEGRWRADGWQLVKPRWSLNWQGATALFLAGLVAVVAGTRLRNTLHPTADAWLRALMAFGLLAMPLAFILWRRAITVDPQSQGPLPHFLGRLASSFFPGLFLFVMVVASLGILLSPLASPQDGPAQDAPLQVRGPAYDPVGFIEHVALIFQSAGSDYTDARFHVAQDADYEQAQTEFESAYQIAQWADTWTDAHHGDYGLNASSNLVHAAWNYSQALATAARSGSECATEYQADSGAAPQSDACARHEEHHARARQASDAWVEEAEKYGRPAPG